MTDEEALKEIDRQEKRFAAAKCGRGLQHWQKTLKDVKRVFAALGGIDWNGEAIRRDTVDLARTALDRLLILKMKELSKAHFDWAESRRRSEGLADIADEIVVLAEKMADLLELHTDYSLWESYKRLDQIERITNPNFKQVLLENAVCSYCRSHQYEAARYLYVPRAKAFAGMLKFAILRHRNGQKLTPEQKALKLDGSMDLVGKMLAVPLETFRPTKPRTPENFRALMLELAAVTDGELK